MSISPFMAGVSGFLKRRRQVKDAQALQQHELEKIKTQLTTTNQIKQAAIPNFYIPGDNGKRMAVTVFDPSTETQVYLKNTIDDVNTREKAENYAKQVHRGWTENHMNWNDEQKAAYQEHMLTAKNILEEHITPIAETGVIHLRDSNNPILTFNYDERLLTNRNKTNININDENGGNTLTIDDIDDEDKPLTNAAYEFARKAVHGNTAYTPDPANNIFVKDQVKNFVDYYGIKAVATAGEIPGLVHQVKQGRLTSDSWSLILGRANEYYGNPGQEKMSEKAKLDRNDFIYNVLRSAASDTHLIKIGSVRELSNIPAAEYGKDIGVEVADSKVKARSAREGMVSLAMLEQNVIEWFASSEKRGEKIEPPLGVFGKYLGSVANMFRSDAVNHITSLISGIKQANGIDTILGQDDFQNRLALYRSDAYIERVGEFQAQYQVWTELLAYQLASTLQGGAGGKTISDQDVLNIKRALGESLFQNGQFQLHRYKQLQHFLSTMHAVHEKIGSSKTVGDLDAANAYGDYIFDYHMREQFGLNDARPHKQYASGMLSRAAISVLNFSIKLSDQKEKIAEGQLVNSAEEVLQILDMDGDPETQMIVDGKLVPRPTEKNEIPKETAEKIAEIEAKIAEMKKLPPDEIDGYWTKIGELQADLEQLQKQGN
jgi:hypothetical protein